MSLMARPLFQPKIIHGIPGRLRVRVPSLQTSPDLKATLEAQMKATPAVETVRISHATDSIIINYRPQAEGMTQTQIYQLITQITQEFFAPNVNHQDREEMAVSETNGTYQERTVALAEMANPVTDDPAITQPESLIPDPEPAVIVTESTDAKLAEVTNDVSSTATTELTAQSLIPDPEPAVITTELTDAKLTELTNDISSTTTTEINSKSLIPDPEPAVIATELTDAKLTEVTNDISSTSTTEITSESLIPDPEPAVIADEVSSTATTEITPERVNTPPPTKPSRRTSPRKPRTRKKPEPPANG
ncbi:HMA2 domain-containing protein [Synechococcus sp. C9]|uniref:HMA2 domain-containing protein n=1 Tax=Synechococcus sp. C9 TaxID=102119 RepID=UPI001FF32685|nr:hypothetical protein [Synechococcus sp. C9]